MCRDPVNIEAIVRSRRSRLTRSGCTSVEEAHPGTPIYGPQSVPQPRSSGALDEGRLPREPARGEPDRISAEQMARSRGLEWAARLGGAMVGGRGSWIDRVQVHPATPKRRTLARGTGPTWRLRAAKSRSGGATTYKRHHIAALERGQAKAPLIGRLPPYMLYPGTLLTHPA
jgi:hypothetical protein